MTEQVISFHYTLTDVEGNVLDTSEGRDPLAFLTGANQIISGLERELVNMNTGDQGVVEVPAADAYGERNEDQIQQLDRARFPEELEVGMMFATDPQGMSTFTVTAIEGDMVTVDANHPLAGKDLTFKVEITDVRAATEEEISHGHVHAEGGCGH